MNTIRELTVSEDSLRELAYTIWLEEGCPDGRAEAHWFEAVRRATGPVAKPKKPAARKAPAKKH